MRLGFFQFLVFVLLSGWAASAQAQDNSMRIAVVVNEDAISQADVQDRLTMVIASAGLPNTKEMTMRVIPQVLDGLIEERIKIQEARRQEITVDEDDIANGLKTIADQNNLTMEQFKHVMRQQGVPEKTLRQQIRAQVAWSRVVQSVLRPQVTVSDNDVDARLDRLRDSIGQTEFFLSEIFLPVEEAEKEGEVRQLANRLVREIKAGKKPFQTFAAQFSRAPGAEKGGDMGWVQEGQLPEDLEQAVVKLKEGTISPPVRSVSGYHILMLRKKRTISEDNIPPRDMILNQIGMERLDRVQQRYLSDLKAEAFIEKRV